MPPITYTRRGNYRFPDIVLQKHMQSEPLTKYGLMRKSSSKKSYTNSTAIMNGRRNINRLPFYYFQDYLSR